MDTPSTGIGNDETSLEDEIPVIQEEIVTDDDTPTGISQVLNMVTTGSPTVSSLQLKQDRRVFGNKNNNKKFKRSILKPDVLVDTKTLKNDLGVDNSLELVYDEDLAIGSVELVGAPDVDSTEVLSSNIYKQQTEVEMRKKQKTSKKIGNHRRKHVNSNAKTRNKDVLISKRNNSNDGVRSPKLQIVLGSGQALPISEGEQVVRYHEVILMETFNTPMS